MRIMTSLRGGASRFAHFGGLTRASRAADDDQEDRSAEDEEDGKDASEDDDADDKPAGKGKRGKAKRADDDDDGKDASEDDDETSAADDDDDTSAEEDDDCKNAADDDEDEMKGKGAVAQARKREQARIAHILGHKAAANNLVLAVSLACTTRMTRREAVEQLKAQAGVVGREDDRGSRHSRADRQRRNPALGSEVEAPGGKQAIAASWTAAFAKVGIKTR